MSLVQPVCRKVQLLAIVHRKKEISNGLRPMLFCQEVPQCEEVAQ